MDGNNDIRTIRIDKIVVGDRHRKDLGDLTDLSESIDRHGLFHPVGVATRDDDRFDLEFGQRRLEACRRLEYGTIQVKIVDLPAVVVGEHDENVIRKGFTTSESVAIGKAVEEAIGNRQGKRTDTQPLDSGTEVSSDADERRPKVPPGTTTREAAAKRAGFKSYRSYRDAAKVVEFGTDGLKQAMDSGAVSISAAARIAKLEPGQQDEIIALVRDGTKFKVAIEQVVPTPASASVTDGGNATPAAQSPEPRDAVDEVGDGAGQKDSSLEAETEAPTPDQCGPSAEQTRTQQKNGVSQSPAAQGTSPESGTVEPKPQAAKPFQEIHAMCSRIRDLYEPALRQIREEPDSIKSKDAEYRGNLMKARELLEKLQDSMPKDNKRRFRSAAQNQPGLPRMMGR